MILDRFRLDDQVAVVTGAGRGLGAAMALAFAEAGADVVIASRTQSQLEEVAEQIKGVGRRAHIVAADLAHPEDTAKLAGAAIEAFGKLDIVVNNVGGTMPNTLLTTSTKDLKDAFTFNVATAHALTTAAVPLMLEHSGGGSIINITSTMGRLAGRGFAAYGTAKAALAHYTRLAALDLCPRIRVNAIAPGSILTSALDDRRLQRRAARADGEGHPDATPRRSPRHRRCRRVSRLARGQLPDRQDARGRRRPHLPQPRPAHPGSVRNTMTELSAQLRAIRVALIGTGNVGKPALVQLINDSRFELTGVWVSSEAKAGKDAAELAGLDGSTGITATNDLDAVLATDPECAVYTALADNRLPDALEDYRRILSAGVNVVGSSAVFLQYPWQVIPEELLKPIEDAAQAGKSSVFVNGIDPGFANDLLPLALAGTCQSIDADPVHGDHQLRHLRQRGRDVRRDGLRQAARRDSDAAATRRAEPGVGFGGAPARRGPRHLTRRGEETYVREPAPEDFDIASGHIRRAARRHCGSRCAEWSTARPPSCSNTSPDCATTCARTGRSRPRRAAPIASRSPVSRRMRWTSA